MRTFRYISRLATAQHGVVRAAQTGATSQTLRRAVVAGELWPLYRGVYAVGHPGLSREGEWLAAVYAAGDGAALAGFSGGKYWKISRFKEPAIQVAVPKRRRKQDGFEIVPGLLVPGESLVRDAIPVCNVPRVLFDMSRELNAEQVANVIHEAAFRKLFDPRMVKRRTKTLDRALELHAAGSAGTRSGLEDRFLKLIRGARLPEPVVNTRLLGFELDFRWPGLNVEIDGDHHDRPRTARDDRIQDAVLREHGFVVLRFREEDLARPDEVLRELAAQNLPSRIPR
ncbi:DUF559 domain-containing protein [Solirubrobacter sp. CPCC 204708]|uniref:DUF559 domain-containing protein n=1 Tax=Solirubrobacter deserti TaxID=2282478 RepID=A0ABT4RN55_9ACTN|nr:DUF559 domain-containing protein [Solirubrobacter deserti]MBE2315036.1 DUF559 domain-containing protein [Solirubrobacter deserti]MDA0139951.1 DUF559 domain-containing protein [Solirubrobacter deserti]